MIELPPIYLASKSPRRHQLLRECGVRFETIDMEIDESMYPDNLPVREIAGYLASEKARAATSGLSDGIVLAADSLVICNEKVLGKPADRDAAVQMLTMLSGNRHEVVTGVCIQDSKKHVLFSEISYVTFTQLSEDELNFYIDTYQPYDKAGAYAIQEWIGLCKIARIEGSYTNIMGLPTERVYRSLASWMHDH